MRTLKFRSYDTVEQSYCPFIANHLDRDLYPHIDVQQWTGLLSKDGVEIYEGDILEYISPEPQDDDHTDRYVVEWRVKEFVGVWLKDRLFKIRDNDGLIDPHLDMLVIGNIWENPELLEVGE